VWPVQVQIRNVRDVLSAGAGRRQLQQVLGFRTLLPVTEVSLHVSSTAAGAAAAAKALDEAVTGGEVPSANLHQAASACWQLHSQVVRLTIGLCRIAMIAVALPLAVPVLSASSRPACDRLSK
jgi:hypothetical protein